MKTINTIEEAVVGRTVTLSSVECLVINNLINDLTRDVQEYDAGRSYINVKRDDLINLSVVMAKITGHDILCLEDVEKEMFSPDKEMLAIDENDTFVRKTAPLTSTVEALEKLPLGKQIVEDRMKGPKVVGKISLTKEDINQLEELS